MVTVWPLLWIFEYILLQITKNIFMRFSSAVCCQRPEKCSLCILSLWVSPSLRVPWYIGRVCMCMCVPCCFKWTFCLVLTSVDMCACMYARSALKGSSILIVHREWERDRHAAPAQTNNNNKTHLFAILLLLIRFLNLFSQFLCFSFCNLLNFNDEKFDFYHTKKPLNFTLFSSYNRLMHSLKWILLILYWKWNKYLEWN